MNIYCDCIFSGFKFKVDGFSYSCSAALIVVFSSKLNKAMKWNMEKRFHENKILEK